MDNTTSDFYRFLNTVSFIGPVNFGSAGDQTGLVNFYNSASQNATAFSAGNATAAVTYTLPTAGPSANKSLLSATTAGVMSWVNGRPIIQIVTASTSTATSSSSNSYSDITNLTASITPSTTTSKILVISNVQMNVANAISNKTIAGLKLLNGGSTLATWENVSGIGGGTATAGNLWSVIDICYLDAPASVSSQTYKLQVAANTVGGGSVNVNDNTGGVTPKSDLFLIEIGF